MLPDHLAQRSEYMDDELRELLAQILAVQKDQAELLKKYLPPLWTKIRFSLLTLLMLMTITSIGMGVMVYKSQSSTAKTTTLVSPPPPWASSGAYQGTPVGGQDRYGNLISPPPAPSSGAMRPTK